MNNLTKGGLGLALLAGTYYAGYASHTPETKIETKEVVRTETKIQQVEKVVREIVTQRRTEPNGTKTETITEKVVADTNTSKDTDKKSTERKSEPVAQVVPERRNWSVGANWRLSPQYLPSYIPSGADVGYRVIGDLWVTGGADWQTKSVLIGTRVEF